jgi:hypothetical protein
MKYLYLLKISTACLHGGGFETTGQVAGHVGLV